MHGCMIAWMHEKMTDRGRQTVLVEHGAHSAERKVEAKKGSVIFPPLCKGGSSKAGRGI
jgi:hypothetical protein